MLIPKRSYRCGYCNLNWPLHDRYERCPSCTTLLVAHRAKPMDVTEAVQRLNNIEHKARYSFHAIIQGAGFTDEELTVLVKLETELAARR